MLTRDASVPKPVSKVCSVLVAVVNWLSRPLLTYSMSLTLLAGHDRSGQQPIMTAYANCMVDSWGPL